VSNALYQPFQLHRPTSCRIASTLATSK
jgi:hypothetical protein